MSDPRSDEELIEAANRLDDTAFATLYHRYRDWVVGLAFRLTGDREVALDVVQESFAHLHAQFPGFHLTCRLKTYLYPVVRHRALALGHRQRRHATEPLADEVLARDAGSAPADLPTLLRSLPDIHREVLALRFVDGLEMAEIAQALDVPTGTVKSRLHNALRRLREDPRLRKLLE